MSVPLVAGHVIEWLADDGTDLNASHAPKPERVVWVGPAGGSVYIVETDTEGALPRSTSREEIEQAILACRARILPTEPFAFLLQPESAYTDAQLRHRDRRYALIKPIAEAPMPDQFRAEVRGPLVRQIIEDADTRGVRLHRKTIYQLLSTYYRCGMVANAVIPRFSSRGGKGKPRGTVPGAAKRGRPTKRSLQLSQERGEHVRLGVNVTAQDRAHFSDGIRLFHSESSTWPIVRTYLETMRRFYSAKERQPDGTWKDELLPADMRPTRRQFRYWFDKVADRLAVMIARAGPRNYNLTQRPMVGDPRKLAFGPGSLFQIDATVADIYLVRADDPHKLIGKPVVYIIIDAFSRLVVGVSVSLAGPSWMEAREALLNMAEDKVAFCARYGVTISPDEWPVAHLPDAMVADRGELLSKNSDVLAGPALGIRISNTGSFRADLKPYVERHFRTLKDSVIRWAPGGYFEARSRGERDYRYDATLTIEDVTRLVIEAVRHYNVRHRLTGYRMTRAMRRDGVKPYAIEIWNWGIRHRIGGLKPGNHETLRRHLLPQAEASITAEGLFFLGRHYMPKDKDAYAAALRRVTLSRIEGAEKVQVSYHPSSLEDVYLPSIEEPRGPLVEWSLIREPDTAMRRLSWFDWMDIRSDDVIASDVARTDDDQAKADLIQVEESIIAGAKRRLGNASAGRSRSSRVQDVKASRAAESERLLEERLAEERHETVTGPESSVSPPEPRVVEFRPRERHTGPPGLIEKLRKRAEGNHNGPHRE